MVVLDLFVTLGTAMNLSVGPHGNITTVDILHNTHTHTQCSPCLIFIFANGPKVC